MELNVGDVAPDFECKDQDGNLVTLSGLKGKKVVLYFYPKDSTPGCTAQACNLRDNYELLLQKGYAVLGVSSDSEKSHKNFIAKQNLPFSLLADTEQLVQNKYGVWKEKSMYGKTYMGTVRTTFVIDEQGKIAEIISKVDTKEHTNQILS